MANESTEGSKRDTQKGEKAKAQKRAGKGRERGGRPSLLVTQSTMGGER